MLYATVDDMLVIHDVQAVEGGFDLLSGGLQPKDDSFGLGL